jgi:hypothetical protein
MATIPGYRLGDPSLRRSPINAAELASLKTSLLSAMRTWPP